MTEEVKSIQDEIRENMEAALSANEEGEATVAENATVDGEDVAENATTDENKGESEPAPATQPHDEPPVALSANAKAKWKELPDDIRAEIHKREADMHKAMTSKDGELSLGRTIKEIAQPYEALIRAEGGTVEGAFKDLLNTSYILRTGSPQQKAQVLLQAAQQFNVDLRPYMGQQPNQFQAMQQEMEYLRQQLNPAQIKQQLQADMARDTMQSEIRAFASDPANVHFESVRSVMGALIQSGSAKDMKEAYQMAIWSDPSIRAQLEAEQKAQADEKRKAEMAAKKKAAASVAGSASAASPSSNAPKKSLEDELLEGFRASQGKI